MATKNCYMEMIYNNKIERKPYCCPVCCGNGLVQQGFYNTTSGQWSTSDITSEKCRSCDGTGIVWGSYVV